MAEQFIASKQLPYVLQSTKLKNFFDSTVDQWFKNENNEYVHGFIGQRQGRLFEPTKDAYVPEPTVDRYNYQLEPSVVVRNADTQTISYQTTYEDLVNKIRFDGGLVNDHTRLFEEKYYSFAPQIDIDKFLNYANYYWYPVKDSILTETNGIFSSLPTISIEGLGGNLVDPETDIIGKETYTSPSGVTFTNGLHIKFTGSTVTNNAFKYRHTITSLVIGTGGVDYAVNDKIIISSVEVGKVTGVDGSGAITGIELTNTNIGDGVTPTSVSVTSTNGSSASITATDTQSDITYIIEGVGTEIKLIDTKTLRNLKSLTTSSQDYLTIQRGAKDGNIWSKSNGWVHRSTLENYPSITTTAQEDHLWDSEPWDGLSVAWDSITRTSITAFTRTTGRRATRPIIEFTRDIELYDYGKIHLLDVTVLENTLTKTQIEGQINVTIDGRLIQNRDTILFTNAASQDDYVQWDSGLWDHDVDSDSTTGGGGATGGDVGWDVSSTTFDLEGSIWRVSGVGESITLEQELASINSYDKVYIEQGTVYSGTEWYYDGYNWNQTQIKSSTNSAPLFNLYDNNKVILNDVGIYPTSTFVGSKIFGYKIGTGTNDIELGFPLSYVTGTEQSDIEFCNYLNVDEYTYNTSTAITGYKYYKQYLYPETIAKTINYEVNINPSKNNLDNNVFYIDGNEQPVLVLQRGNTYNFKCSSPETGSTGYTEVNHPFYISTGTTWTQNGYENELTSNDGVTGSRAYYGGANNVLEFIVPANAPNTLYYHCATHEAPIKLLIVDNPVTKLDNAIETFYKNEWHTDIKKKLTQRLVQEHTVSNTNLGTNVILEVLPTSVLDMEVYKNGIKQKFDTDYTTVGSITINFTTTLVENDFVKIFYKTNDVKPIRQVNYFEIPKNLESNATNDAVVSGSYSEFFQHFESIVQNQIGFTGDITGANNYRDTAKNLGAGTVILQHNGSLLKAMALANNEDLDVQTAIRFVKGRYQEFQLKFLNAVNNIQISQNASTLTAATIVDKAIKQINVDRTTKDPFTYSYMVASGDRYTAESHTVTSENYTWGTQNTFLQGSETQEIFNTEPGLEITSAFNPDIDYDTKAMYVYKNNVQLLVNHEYLVNNSSTGVKLIFLGYASEKPQVNDIITIRYYETIQPTWIPSTPAKLGMAQVYKPSEETDSETYSSGTRNFIRCHDGSLMLKFNDLRDTALLEFEKRVYNTINKRFSNRDFIPLLDVNQIKPNNFNLTNWTREDVIDLLRPVFTRWTTENALNYQENVGYAVTITFDPNTNYTVSNYVTGSYVPATSNLKLVVGETLIGATSGAKGTVASVSDDTNTITVNKVTDTFEIDEAVSGLTSGASRKVKTVNIDWRVQNYSSLTDVNGNALPGHWRGIYKWYYGTDKPHSHPWEILGFAQKPIWWDGRYSWTASSPRAQLISDIEQGIIREGDRENYSDTSYLNVDNVYKKPNFSSFVPVNNTGKLISPKEIGIISANPSEVNAQREWSYGDGAPVENAFHISVAYQFAMQKLLHLTQPGLYVDLFWDSNNVIRSSVDKNQIIDISTGKRPTNLNYYVHSETDTSNTRYIRSGIQNFIVEYLTYYSKSITTSFGDVIRNLQTNLSYRCAGFVDSTTLEIESEAYDSTSKSTSIIVPSEDINVSLHTGGSIQEVAYSGIIVQVVDQGYKIYGYDIVNPYFNTFSSVLSGRSKTVRVGGKSVSPLAYSPGTTYHRDEIVRYESEYYQCTIPHVSNTDINPDLTKWKRITKLPTVGGTEVIHYFDWDDRTVVRVNYGTVFKTRQDVYDTIIGYGRFLGSQGWDFSEFNVDIGEKQNWDYSAKEFLFWSLGKWDIGNYVALSPTASVLKFKPISGVVQGIGDINNGTYSALNKEGYGLESKQLNVIRDNDMITVTQKNGIGIYALRLSVKETEHMITLNNKTIFNDTVYNTILAQRQPRVKLNTTRTLGWNGKLEADGYIISGTQLINNFEKSVVDIRKFYDVDAPMVDTNFRDAAMHLIGFQERDYLTNLKVNKTNQVKFYQGMIKQKGTQNSIDRLLRSTTVSTDQTFDTYEEWAFKVGNFGSTAFNQQLEIRLKANDVVSDPQSFEFLLPSDDVTTSGYDLLTDNIVTVDIDDSERWLKKPHGEKTLANLWPTVSTIDSIIPTAGYVHYDDPTYKAFDSTEFANIYVSESSNVSVGSSVWVAKDVNAGRDWNVYKLYDTGILIDNVVSNGNANTAMKVTISGDGTLVDTAKSLMIHKTYDADDNAVIDPQEWGTHTLTLSTATPTTPTVTIPFTNIAGTGADVVVGNIAGSVASVTVTGGGDGFAEGDVFTFTNVDTGTGATMTVNHIADGIGATATAIVADTFPITTIQVLSKGTGYTTATVNISGGGGTGATATATLAGGEVTSIAITNAGVGYTYQPTVTITGDGIGATAFATLGTRSDGKITAINVTNGGSGYTQVPTVKITDDGGTGATAIATLTGDAVTSITVTTSGGGYTVPIISFIGPLTGSTTGNQLTLDSGGDNYPSAPTSYTVQDKTGAIKTQGVHYTAPTFTFTGDGSSGTFGEIQDLVIVTGGTNYQSPTIKIINDAGTTAVDLTTPTDITVTSGVITAITVPTGVWNQGFSAGIISTATGKITIVDTRANYTVDLSPTLSKLHSLGTVESNVSVAFDGTVGIVVEKWDGVTATPLYTVTGLDTFGVTTINKITDITDNSNITVRANVSVTSSTTGNVSLTLNYTKKEYAITKVDNTPEYIENVDNTTINASGIKLLDWKDVRLNKVLDSSYVLTNTETTLNNLLVGTGLASSVWNEGDLVWLDDDFTGKWGVYRYTANATIIASYNNIRGTEPTALTPTYGGTWILHSGVNYSDSTQTTASYFAKTKRRQSDKINTTQFEKTLLYDDRDDKVNLSMTIYDPLKGIIPAAADREITYKSEVDPAIYNNHSDINLISTSNPWKDEYVGKVWWDQSTTRYIEYENFDNEYRRQHWGRLFDGSSVDVYEWVKSTQLPVDYSGTGTVKSITEYVSESVIDMYTSTSISYFYYWVKNKTQVPSSQSRVNDIVSVSNLITSPLTQGLSYFAPISPNSFMIANIVNNLTKDNSVLQINYRKRNIKDKSDPIHAQWLLIREHYKDAQIPNQIWNKMVDSLCGYDVLDATVPDITLSVNDRYGNKVRPRQTWFKDIKKARKILYQVLNDITSKISLDVEHSNWDNTVLTSVYNEKVNWYYNTSFDDDTVIDTIVDYYADINVVGLTEGNIVKVNYGYNSKWELWQYTDADYLAGTTTSIDKNNLSLVRVGLQTATTKLKTTVYTEDNSIALATELRQYVTALRSNVFISDKLEKQNNVLFALIRYVVSEQRNVDWLFKTTYMNVIQQDTALTQKPSFEKDPFTDIRSYIEEVKPYKVKIRDFLSRKSPTRETANCNISDYTATSDYAINSSGSGTTNPTPKVNTKLVFDRVSSTITLLSPSTNSITTWLTAQPYVAGKALKHNGGYWQVTVDHTSGNFITDVQSGKLQHYNFNPTTKPTNADLIDRVKISTPESTHVDRLAKYHFANELENVDTNNADSVSSFITTLENKIGTYKDFDIQPIGFTVNRERIGQELTSFAWDSLKWDVTAQTTNTTIGYDDDVTQDWYDSRFVKLSNTWKVSTNYTANTFVRYTDLDHITAWLATTSYTVGDIVKHNNKIYVANVTHKNLVLETTMQTSRWDEVDDHVYYTNVDHTASTTFKTDYDAGKWILVQKVLDSVGFARPNHDPYPEEVVPFTPHESLFMTVNTYTSITGTGTNADPYVGAGDYSKYMIHYTPHGTVKYLRNKFIDDGAVTSTADHTTLNGSITKASNIIIVDDASKLPVPKSEGVEVDEIYTSQPGVVYIGQERIEYSRIEGNKLLDVVRGTRGTTIEDHATATEVYSGNKSIPGASSDGFWNSTGYSVVDSNSTSGRAKYLRNE